MRALRDFNVPKIVADDTPVFLGLISDLFPNLDVPRKRDPEFEKEVKHAACDLKLQPEENFIMKIVQLEEILFVRHSVFIVGEAGTGKTQVSCHGSCDNWYNLHSKDMEDTVPNLPEHEEEACVHRPQPKGCHQ